MRVTGHCHCGEITFEADVDPSQAMICHCTDCQNLTGSAFRVAIPVRPEAFRLLSGVPTVYLKTADSGSKRKHAFCDTCGAPVYRMPTDNNPNYSLRVGPLDQRERLSKPVLQRWAKRRLEWITEIASIPEVANQT